MKTKTVIKNVSCDQLDLAGADNPTRATIILNDDVREMVLRFKAALTLSKADWIGAMDYSPVFNKCAEVDMCWIEVDEDEFHWKARLKHCDLTFSTDGISISSLMKS